MSQADFAGNPASVPGIDPRRSRMVDACADHAPVVEFTHPDIARATYRVLVAHDLTGASEIALVRAARLALERAGHLTILHVVDSRLPAPAIAARQAHARNRLESEARRWIASGKLPFRIDVGIGEPASAIAARAQAQDIDLIVTGRHGRRAFGNPPAPATVGRLLRHALRPVLVVSSTDQSPYRRVLVPFDLTSAAVAGIRFAAAFLPQASLHLLHADKRCLRDIVASLPFSREKEGGMLSGAGSPPSVGTLSSFIGSLGLDRRRPLVTIENGNPLAAVQAELSRQKTDLLVWGAHDRSGMKPGLINVAARSLPKAAPLDTLFLPSDRAA
jgi:nucleotide-binding universal stress UspA family protein